MKNKGVYFGPNDNYLNDPHFRTKRAICFYITFFMYLFGVTLISIVIAKATGASAFEAIGAMALVVAAYNHLKRVYDG